ncbi:MAG: hypothetical protein R6V03_06670 [Kiritimatiellia bacterium]
MSMLYAQFTHVIGFEMLQPGFGGVKFRRLPRRFKRTVHVLDYLRLVQQQDARPARQTRD